MTRRFSPVPLLFLVLTMPAFARPDPAPATVTDLARDERVVLFTTHVHSGPRPGTVRLPVRGWVHELESRTVRRRVFQALLEEKYDLEVTKEARPHFDRRVRLLFADNERGRAVVVEIGGRRRVISPESEANGHFATELVVETSELTSLVKEGTIPLRVVLASGDPRVFTGRILLVPDPGFGVISDIDDTVKITRVTDRRALLEHTFLRPFVPAPGMADLYRDWSERGASFHFVSSSPWHLHEPLDEFLDRYRFPARSLSLKMVRLKDSSLLNLFRKGTRTKPLQIEPILRAHPDRKFILVGDSGEQDPEVYASLWRTHPERILRVLIRNVTDEKREDPRFEEVFRGLDPGRWELFTDPAKLSR